MCQNCEDIRVSVESALRLVKLLDPINRTDEDFKAAGDDPHISADEDTLREMGIFALGTMAAMRIAGVVSIIDQVPPSIVLGTMAGHVMESEAEAMAEVLGQSSISEILTMLGGLGEDGPTLN